ncbi:WD40-repeat-containing domain protein, partial [Globomyces pollinis-pini]
YSFGFQSHKRSNVHFVEEHVVVSSIGNVLVFLNIKTGEPIYVQGVRIGSVGAIAVHPTKKYIAFAEVSEKDPNIYIYQYPSMLIHRILRGGAVRGYSDICFNSSGTKIASVAGDPDYMLTIWNWKEESILLRSKAFSQDVYRVNFSPENDGILTSAGMGHIKFWRMSLTFTGLKLQGYIGKFGASELTDIAAFIQLPDGKVLTSTETGNMLLWDGGMIKCEIGIKGKKPCHQGRIESIILAEGEIITGGEDGFVRVWDLETIDNADVTTSSGESSGSSVSTPRIFELEPIDELLIAKDVKIKSVVRFPNSTHDYLIQDQQGFLMKLDLNKRSTDKLLAYHSGPVVAIACSPLIHRLVSLGIDGNLRLYDYLNRTVINKVKYPQGGSAMIFVPAHLDESGSTVIAGFQDGVLRVISIIPNGFVLQFVVKPHKAAINNIVLNHDGNRLITASEDRTLFLFSIKIKKDSHGKPLAFTKANTGFQPIGFITLESPIRSLSFGLDTVEISITPKKKTTGYTLLLALDNGCLFTTVIPTEADVDVSTTFELPESYIKLKRWSLNVPKKAEIEPVQPNSESEKEKVVEKEEDKDKSKDNDEQGQSKEGEHPHPLVKAKEVSNSINSLRKQRGLVIVSESMISHVYFLSGTQFLAAIENQDKEIEIRLCDINASHFSYLLAVIPHKLSVLTLDATKSAILIGCINGSTYIIQFNVAYYLKTLQTITCHQTYEDYDQFLESQLNAALLLLQNEMPNYNPQSPPPANLTYTGQQWTGNLHDVVNGKVTSVVTSPDLSFMMSSGADGGIFIWRNSLRQIENIEFDDRHLDQINQFGQPDDITDSNAYSIQEAKVKSEKDREIEIAENRKFIVRSQIQDLRNEFLHIVSENETASKNVKLNRTELSVDLYLRNDIEADAIKKKETLLRELAWTAEKESIGPTKLYKKFLDPVQTERIELKTFKANYCVSTFRTLKLTQQIDALIEQMISSNEKNNALNGDNQVDGIDKDGIGNNQNTGANGQSSHQSKSKNQSSMKKLEQRKQLRAERAAIWKQLLDSKPDDKYQDPRDTNIFPEHRNIVTEDDINLLQKEDAENALTGKAKGGDDLMGFGSGAAPAPKPEPKVQPKETVKTEKETVEKVSENATAKNKVKLTEMELQNLKVKKTALKYEKDRLLRFMERSISQFDKTLIVLAQEQLLLSAGKLKDHLTLDLKYADIKLQLLFREWMLLKEFEQTDNALADKLNGKKAEKNEIEAKIAEYREKLAAKKVEIEQVIQKEKEIHEDYRKSIGENNKNEEFLGKVFRRKIKRVKKKVKEGGQNAEEEEEEEEDSESEASSYNSDDEGDEEFDEIIPSDCDPGLWQKILNIREKRLDQEEILGEVQKAVEALKKENDSLLKKEKIIGVALKNAEAEIQEFQTLKQRKLNELDVLVPLQFSQVQHLENDQIPKDLNSSLVFFNEGLVQLKRRIKEIQQEKSDIKKQHRELKKQHVSFNKSKKEKQQKVADLTARARDVQMLKFGQIIDLEKLEKLGSNKTADELKEKIEKEDLRRIKEVAEMNKKIREHKSRLTDVIRKNSNNLENLVELQEKKNSLETSLNMSQTVVNTELSGLQKKDIKEREKLIILIQTQAMQIDELKAEIENLIRKPISKQYNHGQSRNKSLVVISNAVQEEQLAPYSAMDGQTESVLSQEI